MKRTIGWMLAFSLFAATTAAQNPKWYKKARKAQLTLVTYAADGSIIGNGTAFYVDENGTALADYRLFENAARVVAVDAAGKERPVTAILGADRLYDVVKFSVANEKKTPSLPIAQHPAKAEETVYILPGSTTEKADCRTAVVEEAKTVEERYHYYTLSAPANERHTNCPVMNAEGEVVGMMQTSAAGQTQQHSYAIGTDYGMSLHSQALSAASDVYRAIGVPTALPDDESQALTFLYMASKQDSVKYRHYLNEFVRLFPANANGYILRAEQNIAEQRFNEAENDYDEGLAHAEKTDEIHYAKSRQIYTLCLMPDSKLPANWTLDTALAEAQTAYEIEQLPFYVLHQGHCLYALHRYDEACRRYLQLTSTNLRSAEIYLYAAQCKKMDGAPTDSILALQDSAVACFSQPYIKEAAPALIARADTRAEAGKYREAVRDLYDYEHLMRNEVNANFYYRRYQLETQCRMLQQALDDIDRASRMEPQEALFMLEKAALLYRVDELNEAIATARRAIEINPSLPDAHRILGVCLQAAGKKEEGQKELKQAAELGDSIAREMLEKE
ncbi:MAG: hypothetical protein NC388_06955 [Clostridium sp.]|nr:hypothetical protein [Clostridium sp.]